MLIDFTAPITTLDGAAFQEGDKDFTLGMLCTSALLAPSKDAEKLSGEKKVERVLLAEAIHTKGSVDVKAEDVAMLKELVNDGYPAPLVVARAWALLDPKAE